jgi:hypothetical protein
MKSLDVVKYIGLAGIQGRVFCAVDSLTFEHAEEAFAGRVVIAMPNGDEMFVARCEHFPELAMAEGSPQRAYDGLMAMIEKIWVVKVVENPGV